MKNSAIYSLVYLGLVAIIPKSGGDPVSLMSMMSKIAPHGPLEYSRYGNYCGLGGGGEPLDKVDECCQQHDACYDQIDEKCHLLHGLLITYKWDLDEANNITCAECSESQFLPFHIPNPLYTICNCKRLICKCDADLVMGFRDNEQYYTKEHLRNVPIAEPGFRF